MTTSALTSSAPAPAAISAESTSSAQPIDVDAAYAPISASVKAIHSRIASNGLVQASLARLQAIVPTAVSERAVSAAGQAQALSIQLAQPIVERVDHKINEAIVGVRALPAYGTAKAQQVDEFAFQLTPAPLKPHYTSAKNLAVSAVQRGVAVTGSTVERARAIKAERAQQLWDTLEAVQAQVHTVRATIEKTGLQATEALHLQQRLADLQAKVTQAANLAQEKRAQARHLSSEVLSNVADLTLQLTHYLENSLLTESQKNTVHSLWARLVERVAGLKAHVYGTPSNPSSPASSSRSDSAASATESVEAAAASADEPAAAAPTAVEESDSKTADAGVKRNTHTKRAHANKLAAKKQHQEQEEEKSKIAAENE